MSLIDRIVNELNTFTKSAAKDAVLLRTTESSLRKNVADAQETLKLAVIVYESLEPEAVDNFWAHEVYAPYCHESAPVYLKNLDEAVQRFKEGVQARRDQAVADRVQAKATHTNAVATDSNVRPGVGAAPADGAPVMPAGPGKTLVDDSVLEALLVLLRDALASAEATIAALKE